MNGKKNDFIIKYDDAEYPEALKVLGAEAPRQIYARGNIALLNADLVAVTGSEDAAKFNMKIEERIIKHIMASTGCGIISGLGRGCDRIAHMTALTTGNKTVAVLPCGFDNIFPKEHAALADEIVKAGGLLLSEYEPDFAANEESRFERVRIMAALSKGAFVVQCDVESESMRLAEETNGLEKTVGCYFSNLDPETIYAGNLCLMKKGVAMKVSNNEEIQKYIEQLKRYDFE